MNHRTQYKVILRTLSEEKKSAKNDEFFASDEFFADYFFTDD